MQTQHDKPRKFRWPDLESEGLSRPVLEQLIADGTVKGKACSGYGLLTDDALATAKAAAAFGWEVDHA